MAKEKFLSPADVAKITGMKLNTVQSWCKSNRLPAEKVGRRWLIKQEDLDDFLEDKDQKKRLFNYSAEANTKVRAKKKAGTLKKITPELIEYADEICRTRLKVIKQRFPEPQTPGVIRDWIMEYMPVGTEPVGDRKGILNY